MESDFRLKKINAKEKVEFHNKLDVLTLLAKIFEFWHLDHKVHLESLPPQKQRQNSPDKNIKLLIINFTVACFFLKTQFSNTSVQCYSRAAIFDHLKPRPLSPLICDLETLNLGLALDLALQPSSTGSGWHRKLLSLQSSSSQFMRSLYTCQLDLRTI